MIKITKADVVTMSRSLRDFVERNNLFDVNITPMGFHELAEWASLAATYDMYGQPLSRGNFSVATDSYGHVTVTRPGSTWYYDHDHKLLYILSHDQKMRAFSYDGRGNVICITGTGPVRFCQRDGLGRVTRETRTGAQAKVYTYLNDTVTCGSDTWAVDEHGNKLSETIRHDELGRVTRFEGLEIKYAEAI